MYCRDRGGHGWRPGPWSKAVGCSNLAKNKCHLIFVRVCRCECTRGSERMRVSLPTRPCCHSNNELLPTLELIPLSDIAAQLREWELGDITGLLRGEKGLRQQKCWTLVEKWHWPNFSQKLAFFLIGRNITNRSVEMIILSLIQCYHKSYDVFLRVSHLLKKDV